MPRKTAPKPKPTQAVIMSGNVFIGFKFIGPFTLARALDFLAEIKQTQNPDIAHAENVLVPLYSPDEARQEIKERGHLMSSQWLGIPRKYIGSFESMSVVKTMIEEGKSTKVKLVLHHDDPPCYARLDEKAFCPVCKQKPDTQSTCFHYYCPLCNVFLNKEMKCPQCKQSFEKQAD